MIPHNKYNSHTADLYRQYSIKGLRYRKVAQALIDAAGRIEGQSVIDLGCGTGLLTAMLSQAVGPSGEVTGVDASSDMIIAAKDYVSAQNVKFVHSPVEEVDSLIGKRVDAVFSSAAFWQFDRQQTLDVLKRLIKPQGKLYFNLSGGFFDLKGSGFQNPQFDNWPYVQSEVMKQWVTLCHERYPTLVPEYQAQPRHKQTAKQLRDEFALSGIPIVNITPLYFQIPRDDEHEWLKIPQWTERVLKGIDYQKRLAILDEIFSGIPANATFIGKWAVVESRQSQ